MLLSARRCVVLKREVGFPLWSRRAEGLFWFDFIASPMSVLEGDFLWKGDRDNVPTMPSDQAPCLHCWASRLGCFVSLFILLSDSHCSPVWVMKFNLTNPSWRVSFADPLTVIIMSCYYCDYYSLGGTPISRDFEKAHPRGVRQAARW